LGTRSIKYESYTEKQRVGENIYDTGEIHKQLEKHACETEREEKKPDVLKFTGSNAVGYFFIYTLYT
jgi:hypothetical protein